VLGYDRETKKRECMAAIFLFLGVIFLMYLNSLAGLDLLLLVSWLLTAFGRHLFVGTSDLLLDQDGHLRQPAVLVGLILSMTANAAVTAFIVFKIFMQHWANRGVTSGNKLRSIMFIIIESGMLFNTLGL